MTILSCTRKMNKCFRTILNTTSYDARETCIQEYSHAYISLSDKLGIKAARNISTAICNRVWADLYDN